MPPPPPPMGSMASGSPLAESGGEGGVGGGGRGGGHIELFGVRLFKHTHTRQTEREGRSPHMLLLRLSPLPPPPPPPLIVVWVEKVVAARRKKLERRLSPHSFRLDIALSTTSIKEVSGILRLGNVWVFVQLTAGPH